MLDSLDQYRKDALNHALLSQVEELELLKRARNGDAAAIARLVETNQLMVMRYARRYYHILDVLIMSCPMDRPV
jgi:DNA-directed RNA polymerase sigma subunit (sigma70/sigma32)